MKKEPFTQDCGIGLMWKDCGEISSCENIKFLELLKHKFELFFRFFRLKFQTIIKKN